MSSSVRRLRAALLDLRSYAEIEQFLNGLCGEELELFDLEWEGAWARDDQLPPEDDEPDGGWVTWLSLGGRGAGKTRAGAEWVRQLATSGAHGHPPHRIALVGGTLDEVRRVMIEGPSGLLAVHHPQERPSWIPSLRRLVWSKGATAEVYSADQPDSLRGPQFTAAWSDETCKWRYPEAAWDMLQFGLRLGERPRQMVTTTPRPIPLLKKLIGDPRTVVTRATTEDNRINLAPGFIEAVIGRYAGTRLGRQEIGAEILDDNPDALWSRALLDRCRVDEAPELGRIVVGVDPPVSSASNADACGIVIAGRDATGVVYVLDDASVRGLRPHEWAARAVGAYHGHEADALVAEVNQGGELVRAVIAQVDPAVAVREVRATRGKWLRAEPVAAAYERGGVFHVGVLAALEDEMCEFEPTGLAMGRSPDRLDALVWALTDLLAPARLPRVRPI